MIVLLFVNKVLYDEKYTFSMVPPKLKAKVKAELESLGLADLAVEDE